MIHHRCDGCGHWIETSEHLIGMVVSCRECGERVSVPARSASNVPHATQPSQVLRKASVSVDTPDDPADEGAIEAGWRRLQEEAGRLVPRTGRGWFVVAGGLVLGVLVASLGLWLAGL